MQVSTESIIVALVSVLSLIVGLWNRLAVAQTHASVADLRVDLTDRQEKRCATCRKIYATKGELTLATGLNLGE